MKYQRLSLFLLGILLSVSIVEAQKTWSLTECIEYAHANNLQIKQTELQADIAENNLFQSKMQILPNLNASAGRSYNSGHFIDPQTNTFIDDDATSDNYGLNSSFNLFSGLRTYNAIKANEFNALSKMQDVERDKINITLQIARAYLTILFSQELKEIAISQRDVTALQVERTSKLVDAGSAARGDLLEIKAQLAAEDLNVTNAQNELNLSYLNLTQLLDLDSVGGFEIFTPDTVEPDFSKSIDNVISVYNEALLYLPHVKSAEFMVKTNERFLAIQKGQLSPTLSLNGNWSTQYSSNAENSSGIGYWDQVKNLDAKSVYFSLNVPIFNRWQVKNDINNAKVGLIQAETTLDQTKQQLYKEIQQSHNDAISAREKFKSASEAVASYSEAFTYTEQKFNVGIVNSVEYNIAKNNFIKAESELLQSKYEYIFSVKILDFYRGIPITL